MVVDADGKPVAPAFAWFDPRGAAQVAAFPAEVRAEFAGRTGPSARAAGVRRQARLPARSGPGARRPALAEPARVRRDDARRTAGAELSLASRTGLLDQDTGAPWPAMLDALGHHGATSCRPSSPRAPTSAGSPTGCPFAGARLTVAGHDHLVAAEADGPIPAARYHVSMGTAEVLLRVIDAPLGYAARARLAEHLINEVRHVVPGKHVLVAGLKTGLLLRRTLQALGIRDRDGRDRLDAAVMAIPYEGTLPAGGIEVAGARNDDGVLALTVRTDDVSPAEVFAAVLRHSNDEIARLVAAMDAEVPAATSATLTGGWAAMASVRRARAAILPDVSVVRPAAGNRVRRGPRGRAPAAPRTHPVRRNHEPAHHPRTPWHDRDLHRRPAGC